MKLLYSVIWTSLVSVVSAATHTLNFNASYVLRNPDGVHERRVIALNDDWPLPIIRIKEDDRLVIHLTNGLDDGRNTSLHFHGIFQENSNWMDGPEMVTQCPIPPGETMTYNFTVSQTGTYWYHSHSGSQYSDGLRGLLIVEPKERDTRYDEDVSVSVCDWYHQESPEIMRTFLSRYNPTGAEPIPQNALFNDTRNATWTIQRGKTYRLRIVNTGMFVSQYVYIEGLNMTVIEIDGVDVEPVETDSLLISVAQRYSVLIRVPDDMKVDVLRFVNIINQDMLDFHPADLEIVSTNWVEIEGGNPDTKLPKALSSKHYDDILKTINPLDDFGLVPVSRTPLFNQPDYQIVLNFTMDVLGNGVTYAMFNELSYTPPKVPTLMSVLSAEDDELASNSQIYGSNTNTFVLQKDEIVEIVLNNMDPGDHPFHLHGHVFQTCARSEGTDDEENPQMYDGVDAKFPEIPMQRDTVVVNANGYLVIRFKADNPGVWFFHCHVDWHLEQGLAITLVEAPSEIRSMTKKMGGIPQDHWKACHKGGVPTKGNAAGITSNWLDLAGENTQFQPLPEGFTSSGYVALILSTFLGLFGILTIYKYGMEDIRKDQNPQLANKLYAILEKYGGVEDEALTSLNSRGERVVRTD
ncbi:iron transport multicopper oxidase Fet5p [[Candida] anglica]|uniref:Iron transport multicopper oxidase Fet5p n=1 Tax=[Candida] anglica TaxID=148631 RepID=A0ABP0EHI5_9ASCO